MDHKINDHTVTVIERCEISPPPGSVPSTTLPLTFFDIPWFYCHPIKRIFLYEFPFPTHHFIQTALPFLKHSLSLSLQHFFPFSANLVVPPYPQLPFIRYLHGDSLCFAVAESTANFAVLVSDSPQDVRNLHPLVPTLPPARDENGTRVIPLMAVQVTVIPNSGFSIGLTYNHLAADGKSLHHFVKYWASLCKTRGDLPLSYSYHGTTYSTPNYQQSCLEGSKSVCLPSHQRNKINDPKGLKVVYFNELQDSASKSMEFAGLVRDVYTNKLRATFVLSREQVSKLKKWVALRSTAGESPHISTFVVTCSLIWVCMMKSEQIERNSVLKDSDDKLCHLVFLADCRDFPELSVPSTYFGNCLASCFVVKKKRELVGENGIIEVANAIEREIRAFKSDPLRKTESLMSDYKELGKPGKCVLVVAGSPKLAVYETDFGWGKPKKSESVHIDSSGSISLSDCRDKDGAIEVGFALERSRMNNFINILEDQLNNMTPEE